MQQGGVIAGLEPVRGQSATGEPPVHDVVDVVIELDDGANQATGRQANAEIIQRSLDVDGCGDAEKLFYFGLGDQAERYFSVRFVRPSDENTIL